MKICFQNIGKVCGIYPLEISFGKSETHEIFESEKFITKTSKPTLNIPSRNDPRNSKKTKTIWNIPLRKSLQKKQIVLNHVRSESDMFIIFQI